MKWRIWPPCLQATSTVGHDREIRVTSVWVGCHRHQGRVTEDLVQSDLLSCSARSLDSFHQALSSATSSSSRQDLFVRDVRGPLEHFFFFFFLFPLFPIAVFLFFPLVIIHHLNLPPSIIDPILFLSLPSLAISFLPDF